MAEFNQDFNNFQSAFYTNILSFSNYTNIEFKNHGYTLLFNMSKGYPAMSDKFLNLKGFNWKAPESPGILKALQRHFINGFNTPRVPYFIYYKQEPITKTKFKETKLGLVFDKDIQLEICSILFIDSKTYDLLLFTDKIQNIGKQLTGQFVSKEKQTKKKTK